jgi:type I restriction enzyme M protein
MITGETKNKVDRLWEMFWTGGLTNPLDVIEQITYLMFIRDLGEMDSRREAESVMLGLPFQSMFPEDKPYLKWSVLKDYPAEKMYEIIQSEVFPFIKNLHDDKGSAYSQYMADAIFKVPTPQLLEKIVTALDELNFKDVDDKGDLYEYLLSKIATAGTNGQFRTPRHIIKMMVELLDPNPKDVICDPACGTGGFLVGAVEYLKEHCHDDIFFDKSSLAHYHNEMFHGYDMDRTMLRIGAMNMMTHGIENPSIEYRDSLSEQNTDTNRYTKIFTNPPFKGSLDYDSVSGDLLKTTKTKKTELLFLTLFLRMLKTGGRCASIVPDGVLFGPSSAHKAIRKEIVEHHRLEAIISMPSGVFKPYAGVSTAVIIFTKTNAGGTDKVWFYDMQADGFSLDDKRAPVEQNNIPDIVGRFHDLAAEEGRKRTEQSFLVPKSEIVGNDYDLSINKYKQMEYVPEEYPSTQEIMADLNELEMQITAGLAKLGELLHE